MKLKFLNVCFLFFLLGGSFISLHSQPLHEGLSPKELQDPNHQELNLDDDKTLLFEQEAKARPSIRDSALLHKGALGAFSKSKSVGKHPVKDEDDALSFNFLYYIIQKFKISDLIDEEE